uniref:Putative ovule protein n=1 Tax=Solanum chacoense TaxID=4108 RepID=A0A0V0GTE4_SOLCH
MLRAIVIHKLVLICYLRFTNGTDDFEANGTGFKLRPFSFLILLGIFPLSLDLLLSPCHLSLSARWYWVWSLYTI